MSSTIDQDHHRPVARLDYDRARSSRFYRRVRIEEESMPARRSSPAPRSARASTWQRRGVAALCAALIGSAAAATAITQTRAQPPPRAAWEPSGPRTTWRDISFIVPAGMQGVDKGDFYDMSGRGIAGGSLGNCAIVILGEVPAGADPARQAQDLLVTAIGGLGQRVANSRGESDLTIDRRAGRSSDGWNWVELSGMLGEAVGSRARIMLIVRGARAVPIIAIATTGNGCVGLAGETTPGGNTITWAALYHSLKLAGSPPSAHLREQIVGRWEGLSATTGGQIGASQGETYAANGRYARASMIGGYGPDSDFLARGFTGEGRYAVEGNLLALFPDRGSPQSMLARIVEDREPTTPPRTTVQLCRINVDVGGPYERCLPRSSR
jgi:hypothetical protein